MNSPQQFVRTPGAFGWVDLAMFGLLAAFIYLLVTVAREWNGALLQVPEIHLEARYLPLYGLFSLSRGIIAYGVSFLFTMVYGYAMARLAGAERVMLPVLDILQSIPVLGFLPGFVLGLVHLFPHKNIGLEIASVLMIFTGQVWNMTFSFYSSLKSVPPDLVAVARLARMSWWERFFRLDLSFAATGLLWNSMMSMAGGWFFLMVSAYTRSVCATRRSRFCFERKRRSESSDDPASHPFLAGTTTRYRSGLCSARSARLRDVHFRIFHAGTKESFVEVNNNAMPNCTLESTVWEDDVVNLISADLVNLSISARIIKFGEMQILQITSQARLFINEKYVTAKDILVGDTISGTVHKRADGVYEAVRIRITKPKLDQKTSRSPNSEPGQVGASR